MRFRSKKFQVLSDFELKTLRRVRFYMNFFTTRQILDWKKHNVLDFEFKILRRVRLWRKMFFFFKKHDFEEKIIFKKEILKKNRTQKTRFDSIYTVKCAIFAFTINFKEHDFEKRIVLRSTNLKNFFFKKHDFQCIFFCKNHDSE